MPGRRWSKGINNDPIQESERKFHWALGPRPGDHPNLSDLDI